MRVNARLRSSRSRASGYQGWRVKSLPIWPIDGALDERIATYDRRVAQVARQTDPAQRLIQAPGMGPVTAITHDLASEGESI